MPDSNQSQTPTKENQRRLRGQVRVWDVERGARRALVRYRRRLRRRTGAGWRLRWVTRPSRHWRASFASPSGVRVSLYYRGTRGQWQLTGMTAGLRALVRAHTGVDPTERAYEFRRRANRRRLFAEHGGTHPPLAGRAVVLRGGLAGPEPARTVLRHRSDGRCCARWLRRRTPARMSRTQGVVLAFVRPRGASGGGR